MNKCINFKLSKRLNDLGLLDNIDTEYRYITFDVFTGPILIGKGDIIFDVLYADDYKTLTLEEVIEVIGKQMCQLELLYPNGGVWNLQVALGGPNFKGTIIECYEQFLEYLLNNNLLGTK